MSDELLIKIMPLILAAVGIFLLLTPRNPWPRLVSGSKLSLRHLRLMGGIFLIVAAIFAFLIFTGRVAAAS